MLGWAVEAAFPERYDSADKIGPYTGCVVRVCGTGCCLYRTFLVATGTRVCAFAVSQRTPRFGTCSHCDSFVVGLRVTTLSLTLAACNSCLFDSHSTKDEWVDYELGTKVRGNEWFLPPPPPRGGCSAHSHLALPRVLPAAVACCFSSTTPQPAYPRLARARYS